MGLDVYLYRCDDIDARTRLDRDMEDEVEQIWNKHLKGKEYDRATQEQKDAARSEGESHRARREKESATPPEERVEIDSAVYPEHMFKIGYLRSSYNDGGVNHVLRNAIGRDLYHVFFGCDSTDDYIVKPDWAACLVRAREVRDAFAASVAGGGYYAHEFGDRFRMNAGVEDEAGALAEYKRLAKEDAERADHPFSDSGWSNASGSYFIRTPLTVHALINSKKGTVFAICKDETNCKFYREATEIVVEMIEWVLGQPDPSKLYLHWSS